jgi:putative ABC transport system permease protein
MGSLLQELRLSLRSLSRSPGFVVSAVLVLALAIGANTAVFSLIESTLLRPYPYPHSEQLLFIRESTKRFGDMSVSYPNYLDWRAQSSDLFRGMAVFRRDSFNLSGIGDPERLAGRMVGSDFFSILGVQPVIGRTFTEQDDRPGAARTVVISHSLWRRSFNSDPRVIGSTITLTSEPYTVIGVLPPGFRFLVASDVFVPVALWADKYKERDDHPGMSVLARLKPGVSISQALAGLNAVAARLEQEHPRTNAGARVIMKDMQTDQTEDFRAALLVLWGAVGLVLLIACANVANLMLARAAARAPELAIRSALGASRWRLARALLTESVLLALLGGIAGVLLATWGVEALLPLMPEILRRNAEIQVSGWSLAFTLALSVATGLAFGALPGLRASRPDLEAFLRDARSGDSIPRRRLRGALVVAEVSLSLMLLIGAGLLLRSYARLLHNDPGFEPRGMLAMQLSLPASRYRDGDSLVRFEQELRRRVWALPGVRSVALTRSAPFLDDNSMGGFWIEGRERPPPGEGIGAFNYDATPGFLQTMGGRLLRGRDLTEQDDIRNPVVLIDDVFASKVFPNEDPIGHRLAFPPELQKELKGPQIVGVYRHFTNGGLDDPGPVRFGMILPYKLLAQFVPQWGTDVFVLVRAEGDPQALAAAVRREVLALDGELPVFGVRSVESALEDTLAGRRFSLLLLGIFAATALLLAAVGVYGVMSYAVVQRTREIGIRMALGARQDDVLRLVVGGGARLAAIGIAIGLLLALGLSRVLSGMLYGVSAADPLTYGGIALLLAAVALVSSWLPARRAARVDPAVALRAD